MPKKKRRCKPLKSSTDNEVPAEEEILPSYTDENSSSSSVTEEELALLFGQENAPLLNVKVDDYVLCKIVYNFGTKKGTYKLFIGKVEQINVGRRSDQCEVLFLPKKSSRIEGDQSTKCYFVYPTIPDRFLIGKDDIIQKAFLA